MQELMEVQARKPLHLPLKEVSSTKEESLAGDNKCVQKALVVSMDYR